MNVDLIRFGRLASTPTVFHRNWLLLSRARNGSSSRNLSTFVDDRWEGEGGRDILIRWRSIIRTGFDIYILRRRIDEFSLGFGDGRRFWREREGDCNVTSRDLGRNVCPLEEGFHINCFTKSVHKVWCNVIPFYALLDHIYIYIYIWWNMQRKLKAFELYGDPGAMFWSRVSFKEGRKERV